jgi:hypothetical protein
LRLRVIVWELALWACAINGFIAFVTWRLWIDRLIDVLGEDVANLEQRVAAAHPFVALLLICIALGVIGVSLADRGWREGIYMLILAGFAALAINMLLTAVMLVIAGVLATYAMNPARTGVLRGQFPDRGPRLLPPDSLDG